MELSYRKIFIFKFMLSCQQSDIGPIFCHRCHLHRWQICRRCKSTTLAKLAAKFATGVVDTSGAPWLANISTNFCKKFERVQMGYSGAGGNWFMKKKTEAKISWHCPINKSEKLVAPVISLITWIKRTVVWDVFLPCCCFCWSHRGQGQDWWTWSVSSSVHMEDGGQAWFLQWW